MNPRHQPSRYSNISKVKYHLSGLHERKQSNVPSRTQTKKQSSKIEI